MRRLRRIVIASLAFLPIALGIAACSSPPEQPVLNQFFRAARLRDATALRGFATTSFEPNVHGTISRVDIVSVAAEHRAPLNIQTLAKEQDAIREEEAEFTRRKDAYQVANMEAIQRVVRAEAQRAQIDRKDVEVQTAWSKLRDESIDYSRRVTDAQRKLASESSIAKLSLQGTGGDPIKQDGELVSKDVTVAATVRQPDGAAVDKTLVVTLQRAVIKGNPEVAGKWIVTAVKDSAAPAATKTS